MLIKSYEKNGIRIEMCKNIVNGLYSINKFIKDKRVEFEKQGTGFNYDDAEDVFELMTKDVKSVKPKKKVLGLF